MALNVAQSSFLRKRCGTDFGSEDNRKGVQRAGGLYHALLDTLSGKTPIGAIGPNLTKGPVGSHAASLLRCFRRGRLALILATSLGKAAFAGNNHTFEGFD